MVQDDTRKRIKSGEVWAGARGAKTALLPFRVERATKGDMGDREGGADNQQSFSSTSCPVWQ